MCTWTLKRNRDSEQNSIQLSREQASMPEKEFEMSDSDDTQGSLIESTIHLHV